MSEMEESECYTPEKDRFSEQGQGEQAYKRRVQKLNKNSIEGKWTEQQNLKYILYMDYHYKTFVSKEKRKSQRIFKSLSAYLSTRTPRQCRSHFQKLINKFKKIKKVKQHYQDLLGLDKYQAELQAVSTDLKNKTVKIEDTQMTKCIKLINEETQTEPLKVSLTDLSNVQLMKLMNLLNEYQKIQITPIHWMKNQQIERIYQGN